VHDPKALENERTSEEVRRDKGAFVRTKTVPECVSSGSGCPYRRCTSLRICRWNLRRTFCYGCSDVLRAIRCARTECWPASTWLFDAGAPRGSVDPDHRFFLVSRLAQSARNAAPG